MLDYIPYMMNILVALSQCMTNDNTAIRLFFTYFMFTEKYLSQGFIVCKSICNAGWKRNVFKTERLGTLARTQAASIWGFFWQAHKIDQTFWLEN